MKAMKKLSCVLLAVLLLMSLSVTAFAAESTEKVYAQTTITIEDEAGHTYKVYQILKGDYAVVGEGEAAREVLSNVVWGKDVDDETKTASTAEEALKAFEGKTGEEVSAAYIDHVVGGTVMTDYADGKYTLKVDTGYYLIVEENAVNGETVSKYMVQVADETAITPKRSGIPEFQKKVKDVNDSTDGVLTDWQDSADWDVNDVVPFQLKAKLPTGLVNYDAYTLTFHDTLSSGLTFDAGSVKVYKNGTLVEGGYALNQSDLEDGCSFEIVITDVKAAPFSCTDGDEITVEYDATLNNGAVIGGSGNPNTAHLEFSNNPNNDGTGKTEDDKVTVFTFQLEVNKVQPGEEADPTQPLTGAAFKLEKYIPGAEGADGTWKDLGTVGPGDEISTFDFNRIDDGQYRLTETVTPPGFNSIDPIYFTVTANHTEEEFSDLQLKQTNDKWEPLADDDVIFKAEPSGGMFIASVLNQSGLQLPETGGIGTTIFYTVGGILVAAALVLLITKKRMSKEG